VNDHVLPTFRVSLNLIETQPVSFQFKAQRGLDSILKLMYWVCGTFNFEKLYFTFSYVGSVRRFLMCIISIYVIRSVNFKFIPEPVFVSKGFAIFLLAAHLILLASFAHYSWCK